MRVPNLNPSPVLDKDRAPIHFLENLENLEILETLENPRTVESKGESDHFLEILENLDRDFRDSRGSCCEKTPFRNDPLFRPWIVVLIALTLAWVLFRPTFLLVRHSCVFCLVWSAWNWLKLARTDWSWLTLTKTDWKQGQNWLKLTKKWVKCFFPGMGGETTPKLTQWIYFGIDFCVCVCNRKVLLESISGV